MRQLINIEDKKQIFVIDAIRYFFLELAHTFDQVQNRLTGIEQQISRGTILSEDETLLTIISCWKAIDTTGLRALGWSPRG
jgi:hypothetical protein